MEKKKKKGTYVDPGCMKFTASGRVNINPLTIYKKTNQKRSTDDCCGEWVCGFMECFIRATQQ